MNIPQGTSKDRVDSPFSLGVGVPCDRTSIPASFPERPAFLSKEAGPVEAQVMKDQEHSPNKLPSRENGRVLDVGQSKAEGICGYSLSPSELSGGARDKESPESPFEVITDKAAFDREFKDSYKECTSDLGVWAVHTDGESPADLLESNDKVFPLRSKEAGRYPASALLPRQFSHTTATLEEVSRCVNDMHNFTNEILTWDLVPQVKQQTDKSSDCTAKSTGLERSECHSEIPVINLKMNTHQKMPVSSLNGSTPITKSTGKQAEASLLQERVTGKSVRDHLNSLTEASNRGMQGSAQIQSNAPSGLPGAPGGKPASLGSGAAAEKVGIPEKDALNWPSSVLGGTAEADSSGESEDTVIEDITAGSSFENNRLQPEEPASVPNAVAKTSERELKEIPSCQTVQSEASQNSGGPRQAQPNILGRSPDGEEVTSQVLGTSSEVAPKKPPMTVSPKLPSATLPCTFLNETEFSLTTTTTTSANSELSHGKHVKDVDDSSPEDLLAAFTETPEKGIVEKEEGSISEAVSETAYIKSTLPVEILHESELGGSEIEAVKSESSEHRETSGHELLGAIHSQGTPVASLDLEQEQLTIRALKELGERQMGKGQGEGESPGRKVKQVFVPQSRPQRSSDFLEHTGVESGSDPEISKKPAIIEESRIDTISGLSKTEVINWRVLARLLTDLSGNHLSQKYCMCLILP